MKKIQIVKLTLGLSLSLTAGNVFAQSSSDVIKAKFPEVVGELAITENTTYNPALKDKYRALYTKFEDGLSEIDVVEHVGVNEVPELTVFDAKTLKDMQKSGSLDELKAAVKSEQRKIATLMREEKYGADSATCIRLVSMFSEYVKQNALEDAYDSWTVLFKEYPKASQSIYSNGVNIVKKKMMKAKDRKEQELWIDTLMMVYDQRIKYFAATSKLYGEAYILGRKGVDLLKVRKDPIEEPYNILMKAIDMGGKSCDYAVIQTAMQSVIGMYNEEKIDASVVVDKYVMLADIIGQKREADKKSLENAANDKDKKKFESELATCEQVQAGVDNLFSTSSAAQCDVLVKAFTPRFQANPNDKDLADKIVKVLGNKGCTDTQLYEDAVTAVIANNPTETACAGFARMLEKKGKEDEAVSYYEQAITLSTADTLKARYNCSIAKLLQKKGQLSNARSYARKAIELNPNYGLPYILIATMYGSSPVGEDSFDKSKTYWLVIDKLQKAKAVDPSIASEAQQLINRYIGSCPKKEEAFMHSITAGQTIQIGGWIGESTTARF